MACLQHLPSNKSKTNRKSNEEIKDDMNEAIKETKDLEEEIKKLEQKLTEKKSLNWEDKKQLQDLLQKTCLQKRWPNWWNKTKRKTKRIGV